MLVEVVNQSAAPSPGSTPGRGHAGPAAWSEKGTRIVIWEATDRSVGPVAGSALRAQGLPCPRRAPLLGRGPASSWARSTAALTGRLSRSGSSS